MSRSHNWLVLAMALCLAGLHPAQVRAADAPAYPDTTDGLKRLITDLYAAVRGGEKKKVSDLVKALVLPKHRTWFKEVFGPEKGEKVAGGYDSVLPVFERQVKQMLAKVVSDGRSVVTVLRFDRAPDRMAVGLQNDAMAAMKKPVPLYSVRFVKPGERLGQHVYSFVYVDGGFRLVGKMQGFRD